MPVHAMVTHPPLMPAVRPDFRIPPPRLSPGVLAVVMLLHLSILALILTLPHATPPLAPPAPLYVRLIEPAAVQPEIAARPEQPQRPPPPRSMPTPPVPTAPPTPVQPKAEAVRAEHPPQPVEPVRPESMRPEPQPAPLPAPAPAPAQAAPPPVPVTQPRFNADYLDNPKPPYPSLSRRMGEEGEVRLRVHVDAAGHAQRVELYRSSGFPRLDQAAQDTVRQWRFIPARQGEQPIPAWVIVPIQFSLRS